MSSVCTRSVLFGQWGFGKRVEEVSKGVLCCHWCATVEATAHHIHYVHSTMYIHTYVHTYMYIVYSMLQYVHVCTYINIEIVHVCMYINIEIVRVTTAWGTRGCSA